MAEDAANGIGNGAPKKRGRGRPRKHAPAVPPKPDANPYEKLKIRVRGQVTRMMREQHFLDTYRMDGWRGASKEKLKPHKELQRAKRAIAEAQQIIRDCMRQIDDHGGDTLIPQDAYTESGELPVEAIICSKCGGGESVEGNDILLCDGYCYRAFHQCCHVPPVSNADIPPGDEGWLCAACDAKVDCIYHINAVSDRTLNFGTPWHAIRFAEEAVADRNASADEAAPSAAAPQGTGFLGMDLPSEESGDEDFDPSAASASDGAPPADATSSRAAPSATSDGALSGSSDSEEADSEVVDEASVEEEEGDGEGAGDAGAGTGFGEGGAGTSAAEAPLIVEGRRKKARVDYAKLNATLFGDREAYEGEGLLSDGEWQPSPAPKHAPSNAAPDFQHTTQKAPRMKALKAVDREEGVEGAGGVGGVGVLGPRAHPSPPRKQHERMRSVSSLPKAAQLHLLVEALQASPTPTPTPTPTPKRMDPAPGCRGRGGKEKKKKRDGRGKQYTKDQADTLKAAFAANPHPKGAQITALCDATGLSAKQIGAWMAQKRFKTKKRLAAAS